MDRFLCQLCNRIVAHGETHTCFVFKNNDDVYTLPLLEESNKTDKNNDDEKDKIVDNSSEISLNLIPELSQKENEKSEVSCMPASPKIQVSSLLDISNEECDMTLEESKLKSLKNDKEMFMHYLDKVTEQLYPDDKTISETSNLIASSDFSFVNEEPYNNNKIQEYRYEQNYSEEESEAVGKIEEMSTNRNESMYSKKNGDAMSGPSEMRASKKSFRGEFCTKEFSQKSNLKTKSKKLVEDEKSVAGPSGIGTHKETFQVHMNPKKFISKTTKEERHKTSASDKSFVCETCKRQFSHKRNLKTHSRVHTGEKLHACDQCERKFTSEANLVRHYRIHTGERPFVCDECGKAFADKYNLAVHLRTHTGEKPYKCSVCEKAFTSNHNRNSHQRKMHKNI